VRSYHTSLEAAIQELKKKKKPYRSTKTASELLSGIYFRAVALSSVCAVLTIMMFLSVTENRTCQRTATITKLRPQHISRLLEQPETSLDQLHRLKFPTPGKTQSRPSTTTSHIVENVGTLETTDAAHYHDAFVKSASTSVSKLTWYRN